MATNKACETESIAPRAIISDDPGQRAKTPSMYIDGLHDVFINVLIFPSHEACDCQRGKKIKIRIKDSGQ